MKLTFECHGLFPAKLSTYLTAETESICQDHNHVCYCDSPAVLCKLVLGSANKTAEAKRAPWL